MSKQFVINESSADEHSIPKSTLTDEQIKAYLADDGYDMLRIKALKSSVYEAERENALSSVERQIKQIKQQASKVLPSTTIRPFEDRVLIWPDKPVTMTESGIYIPDEVQQKELPDTGTVAAAGPGRYINGILNPVSVKVGDRVYYGKYAGTPIEDKKTGETFLVMRFADLFAGE